SLASPPCSDALAPPKSGLAPRRERRDVTPAAALVQESLKGAIRVEMPAPDPRRQDTVAPRWACCIIVHIQIFCAGFALQCGPAFSLPGSGDRKSTRLNSSHT